MTITIKLSMPPTVVFQLKWENQVENDWLGQVLQQSFIGKSDVHIINFVT